LSVCSSISLFIAFSLKSFGVDLCVYTKV
jgi:hypothetical protein